MLQVTQDKWEPQDNPALRVYRVLRDRQDHRVIGDQQVALVLREPLVL